MSVAEAQRQEVLRALTNVINAVGPILPPNTEIVLHDVGQLPTSIVAIQGTVTGRAVGLPATDFLLKHLSNGGEDAIYESRTSDGRRLKSLTTFVRDRRGAPIAAVCVNVDLTALDAVKGLLEAITAPPVAAPTETLGGDGRESTETFVRDVDELGQLVLNRAMSTSGVPVELMRKKHKKAVVRELQDSGYFTLRESVESAATALGVTRFTIYNYLNEIREEVADVPAG